MDWTRIDNRSNVIMYYVAKIFGFVPLSIDRGIVSSTYSWLMWISLGFSGACMIVYHYETIQNVTSKNSVLAKVIFIEVLLKFVVAVANPAIFARRIKGVFRLRDEFDKFDVFTLRAQCPPDLRTQTYYLLYVSFIGVFNFVCAYRYTDVVFYVLFAWNLFCASTMLAVVQYVTYVRMLRDRYALANTIFANSVTENVLHGTEYMYPKEINRMFIELRGLTDEVKTDYAYHAILFIVETVSILISCTTTLTVNYLNESDTTFVYNACIMGHCSLRLLFLFFVVRETHNVKLEANNTALIGHEALNNISDTATTKHLEIIILNCWNHPFTFDVHDFFDLDYKLLQSIIASVVTYVVIFVQIQLVIMMDM